MPAQQDDRHPTQGMADDDRKGARGVTMPRDERGAGGGGPIGPKDGEKDFRGG